jgi:hypothetical protein
MRKPFLVLVLIAAACGGSSSSTGTPPTPLGGRINGHAFTPAAARAMVVGSGATPCSIGPGVSVGFKALVVEAATYPGVCGDLTAIPLCTRHPSSQTVTVLIAKVNQTAPYTEPALTTGTYLASADLAMVAAGEGWAQTLDVGLDPTTWTTSTGVTGTIRIDAIPLSSTAPVTGHVALSFGGADTVAGDFSADYCTTGIPDACTMAQTIAAAIGGSGAAGICTP